LIGNLAKFRHLLPALVATMLATCTGCVLPAIAQPNLNLKINRPKDAAPARVIVLQCWDMHDLELVGVRVTTTDRLAVAYLPRPYFIVYGPLGLQFIIPPATVAAFAEDCRPAMVCCNYGRMCCGPPQIGPYAVDLDLHKWEYNLPVERFVAEQRRFWYKRAADERVEQRREAAKQAPEDRAQVLRGAARAQKSAAHAHETAERSYDPRANWTGEYVERELITNLAGQLDRLDRVLQANKDLSPTERTMVYGQLARMANEYAEAEAARGQQPDEMTKIAAAFAARAAQTEN